MRTLDPIYTLNHLIKLYALNSFEYGNEADPRPLAPAPFGVIALVLSLRAVPAGGL